MAVFLGWLAQAMPRPPRGQRPLRDAGKSRSAAPYTDSVARPSALRPAPLRGTGLDLRAEKPSRPATLGAVLRLHMVPNLSCMRRASILEFQTPRPNPLSPGGLPKSPFMALSCFGAGDRPPPGPFCPRLRPRPPRPSRRSRPWTAFSGLHAVSHIPPRVLSPFLGMAARGASPDLPGSSRPRIPASDTSGCIRLPALGFLMGVWGMWGDLYLSASPHFFESL